MNDLDISQFSYSPAFPCFSTGQNPGMTLRTWLAGLAMQGMLAEGDWEQGAIARHAVKCADCLIRELLKPGPEKADE